MRLDIEKLRDVHRTIKLIALKPRIKPMRAKSSRSEIDKVLFAGRVRDVSGFELWSATASDGRLGTGM